MVVARLALAYLAVVETMLVAELHIGAVGFVASAVDVVQVDGHEEALDCVRTDFGLATG